MRALLRAGVAVRPLIAQTPEHPSTSTPRYVGPMGEQQLFYSAAAARGLAVEWPPRCSRSVTGGERPEGAAGAAQQVMGGVLVGVGPGLDAI